jgi:hypothetical protein
MGRLQLVLAPDTVRADLTEEIANRIAADAAIIASGVTPSNVNLSPVLATGTTAVRTIADRFADTVNPLDFGAAGDGSTNDQVAVQTCVDYCLSFSPPKAMIVTHRHLLASSVMIDRGLDVVVDDPLPKSYFKVIGQGDLAGFVATTNINLFSSNDARVGADLKSGRVSFQNIGFEGGSLASTANVLDEKFTRMRFIECNFHFIRAYNYAYAFTQEFRFLNCLITSWTGMFASSIGSYNNLFSGCSVWDVSGASTGLYASIGNTYSANVIIENNVIEALGGPIATISGAYGCSFRGNQIEYIEGTAFLFSGLLAASNITFEGNYCILYAGPFVSFQTAYSGYVTSIGNNLTVTQFSAAPWVASHVYAQGAGVVNGANVYTCTTAGTSAASGGPTGTGTGIVDGTARWAFVVAGGARVMYGGMANVAGLISSGDQMTRADGLSGDACVISDATHITRMNGIERHGNAVELWTDTDSQLTKDTTGHFGFGRAPVAAARATFQGEDQLATHFAGSFVDGNGNAIALFRNDRHVLFPALPTSAAGLASGEVWNDSGTLKVVT